jgi:hypothetical protein
MSLRETHIIMKEDYRKNMDLESLPVWKASEITTSALVSFGCVVFSTAAPLQALSNQPVQERQSERPATEPVGTQYSIPGASFPVVQRQPHRDASERALDEAAAQTVVEAFAFMLNHRKDYPRFDESMDKQALQEVVIEPTVINQEGKSFLFLVARTAQPGQVRLLISAEFLRKQGYVGHPETLVPALAKEFQWVVSKADTGAKFQPPSVRSDLAKVPIRTDQEIAAMSADERLNLLRALLGRYLHTVDEHNSLNGQSHYDAGSNILMPPAQPDSTTKLYDIRVREALQKIVHDPWFIAHTPKAVRCLLNGTIWNVAFVKIDQRDWATRTRVVPKTVVVGEAGRTIQPATILVNTYRVAMPDDPFYGETNGLPMGALSADQVARVIAKEIEQNIIEKSMRGHVAQDELTMPK